VLQVTNDQFDELVATTPSVRAGIMTEVGRRLRRIDEEAVHQPAQIRELRLTGYQRRLISK
jgi:hypothetical protein